MTTGADCRRKAGEWLNAAQVASDPKTSASMRRVSDLWIALAQRIEQSAAQFDSLVRQPADLAGPRNFHRSDSVQLADVLRERLHLNRGPFEATSE